MRRLRARERLAAQEDINAALMPAHHKQLLLYLTMQGYGEDEAEYAPRVHAIASLGGGGGSTLEQD